MSTIAIFGIIGMCMGVSSLYHAVVSGRKYMLMVVSGVLIGFSMVVHVGTNAFRHGLAASVLFSVAIVLAFAFAHRLFWIMFDPRNPNRLMWTDAESP